MELIAKLRDTNVEWKVDAESVVILDSVPTKLENGIEN
jgi:hypothetical protein